jgi:hypothetical protein
MRFSHSLVYSAFTSFLLIQNCAVALSSSRLPRVNAVINAGSGVGCSLHFPDDMTKKKKTIYTLTSSYLIVTQSGHTILKERVISWR